MGFNAGLSALLLLEAVPTARVLSFDLGDQPWSKHAAHALAQRYRGRGQRSSRFLGVVFGDSAETIPRYKREHPGFACDVAFVDGSKSYQGRKSSLNDLRAMASANAVVFLDEVTSQRCINGSLPLPTHTATCRHLNPPYYAAVRAYDNFCRKGQMRVLECAWPKGRFEDRDGICMAQFM